MSKFYWVEIYLPCQVSIVQVNTMYIKYPVSQQTAMTFLISAQDQNCIHVSGTTCLKFYDQTARNWTAAQLFCESEGGNLVVESDTATRSAIVGKLPDFSPSSDWWIGAYETDLQDWTWADDSVLGWLANISGVMYARKHTCLSVS